VLAGKGAGIYCASGIQIRMRKSPDTDATQDRRRGNLSQGSNGYAKRTRCKWCQGDGTDVPARWPPARAATNKRQKRKKGQVAAVPAHAGTACLKCEPNRNKSGARRRGHSSFWI